MSIHTQILKYSHFFVVKNPTEKIIPLLYRLSSNYTQFGFEYDPRTRKQKWGPLKTYAIYVDHGREFRFHKGQWKDFEEMLTRSFIDTGSYTIEEISDFEPAKIEVALRPKWVLRPDQEQGLAFVTGDDSRDNNAPLLLMPTGTGKAIPVDYPVKVPGGWVPMVTLELGDHVTGKDGKPTTVTGIYPQGSLPMYTVTFRDGRTAECCMEHLWKVTSADKRAWTKVITTYELARLLKLNTYKKRLYIDLPDPEDCPDKDFEIDPYILGLFLGDGCLRNRTVSITTPDQFIVNKVAAALSDELSLRRGDRIGYYVTSGAFGGVGSNSLLTSFRKLQLQEKYSYEKHIPEEYFHGSAAQRLALIQGLLDTDGTVDRPGGSISYSSTSLDLAEGMVYLIRSIGGMAKISLRHPTFTYKGVKKDGRLAYQVNIRHKRPSELFQLPRKKELTNDNNQYADILKLRIDSVEYSGHKDAQCISVSGPDRQFVIKDFVVTHNTLVASACVAKRGYRFAVIVVGGLVDKWVADICANLDMEPADIGVIQGSDLLIRTTHYPESGKPIPKAFVISISTQAKWYKLYEECMDHPKLDAFACCVDDFCQHLGIGTVVFDEVHLHPHGVYRVHCYLHVPKTISLTATLLTKEQSLQKVQSMMFPRVQRFDTVKMKQYITAHACAYQIMNFMGSKILTTEHGRNTYSQAAFEKSILRHRRIAPQYITMILDLIQTTYIDEMLPGDKIRIFVGTAKMANELMRATKARWPQYDTRTYLESDPYCNIIDSEIGYTTIIGAGAAIDIPLLRIVIMTNSIDSPNANVQILGRLRELKDRDTRFYYTYCTTIPKHVDYHNNKIDIFKSRVLEQKQLFIGTLYP